MGRIKQSRPIKRRRVVLEQSGNSSSSIVLQHTEDHQQCEMNKAIELLRKIPSDQVEAAAAEATRIDLARSDRWIYLKTNATIQERTSTAFMPKTIATIFDVSDDDSSSVSSSTNTTNTTTSASGINNYTPEYNNNGTCSSAIPRWSRGLGFARLSTQDFRALQALHRLIKDRINNNNNHVSSSLSKEDGLKWLSWSGAIDDPRKRAFGFLPGTWGHDPRIRNDRLNSITMPSQKNAEKQTAPPSSIDSRRSMLVLENSEMPKGVETAIRNLCEEFRNRLLQQAVATDDTDKHENNKNNDCDDRHYRYCLAQLLRYEYLIAAQPNLHSGRELLPLHLDDPRSDGFGVLIVTIGMEGSATILLRDSKGIRRGVALKLNKGEAYLLSDKARDACSHGVLEDKHGNESAIHIAATRIDDNTNNNEDDHSTSGNKQQRESLNLRFGLHDLEPPPLPTTEALSLTRLPIVPTTMVLRNWE